MTGRASFLRRLEGLEAAHVGRVEETKRAQLRAALLALPPAHLRALRDEGRALQDPKAWAAFLEEARAFYAAHMEEAQALEGAAKWAGRWKGTKAGEAFPLPDPAHVAPLEAHAARLWASQEEAGTEEARRFFRYSAASCGLRAKLARVLLDVGT